MTVMHVRSTSINFNTWDVPTVANMRNRSVQIIELLFFWKVVLNERVLYILSILVRWHLGCLIGKKAINTYIVSVRGLSVTLPGYWSEMISIALMLSVDEMRYSKKRLAVAAGIYPQVHSVCLERLYIWAGCFIHTCRPKHGYSSLTCRAPLPSAVTKTLVKTLCYTRFQTTESSTTWDLGRKTPPRSISTR